MTDFGDHSPRRYFVDENGQRVLIGLTVEETTEFDTLDADTASMERREHRHFSPVVIV